ncbi:MAG: DUF1819 family protein [Deltaproteobacteria bacterium]|nr:DUF1819 family protein [Deltaproteobacteria bacterium]
MSKDKYNMSFTTGGLFHVESIKLAKIFLETNDWDIVRENVLANNLLQSRTMNTSKRNFREIVSRLKCLSPDELYLLVDSNLQDQGYILWVAVCRRYKFIAEFAIEVLRERYISLKNDLHNDEFDYFFNRKSEWHPELDMISSSTRLKLRQVLFKILREADLLTSNNIIHTAMLSPRLLNQISCSSYQDVLHFPVFESDLRGMSQ